MLVSAYAAHNCLPTVAVKIFLSMLLGRKTIIYSPHYCKSKTNCLHIIRDGRGILNRSKAQFKSEHERLSNATIECYRYDMRLMIVALK